MADATALLQAIGDLVGAIQQQTTTQVAAAQVAQANNPQAQVQAPVNTVSPYEGSAIDVNLKAGQMLFFKACKPLKMVLTSKVDELYMHIPCQS